MNVAAPTFRSVVHLVGAAVALLVCAAALAGQPQPGTRYFQLDGARGDVILVTGPDGTALDKRRYGAWGDVTPQSEADGVRPGFTGIERDGGTGLHYFNARYYDAALGRFLSPDPLGQFRSPYLYAFDAPLAHVDPSGMGGKTYFSNVSPFRFIDGSNSRRLLIEREWQRPGSPDNSLLSTLKYAYYFRASVLLSDRRTLEGDIMLAVPKSPPRSAKEADSITSIIDYDNKSDYFDFVSANQWHEKMSDRSVVVIYDGHGDYIDERFLAFDEVKQWRNKYIACIDLGCEMFGDDDGISDHYLRRGIPYVSSDVDISTPNLDPPSAKAGGRSNVPPFENYVDTVASWSAGGWDPVTPSWYYQVPDAALFRVGHADDVMYHFLPILNSNPGAPRLGNRYSFDAQGYEIIKSFDFNYYPSH